MSTAYTAPGNDQDNNQWDNELESENNTLNNSNNQTLENSGPNKNQDFKVLNPDGSLPDLPDQDVPGGGALEGTVGLGT